MSSWATLNRAERREAIVGAAAAGVSPAKLARQLGAAVTAITALAEREGIAFHESTSPSNRGANAGGKAWQGGGSPADGWSEARIAYLQLRVKEGVAFSAIASELGISRNAAIGKATRLGLQGDGHAPAKQRAARPPREPKNYTAIRKPARGNANGGLAFKLAAGTVGRKKAEPIAIPPRPRVDMPKLESLGVTLLEVRDEQCKYPDGELMDRAVTYCGQPAWKRVVRGEQRLGPWCEYHARLCYQPVGERANRSLARSATHFGRL